MFNVTVSAIHQQVAAQNRMKLSQTRLCVNGYINYNPHDMFTKSTTSLPKQHL